ncbi:MAG: hypothetical protein C0626_09510 [Arcobacter sp.]|uniref:hypothetical protein n=1 Tax=uncultured Arcobacter sp. TaxID=165434 RepID=UPI000CA6BE8F|nr:hypothetical protein [uncultured Arcobacter sp.]PLY09227.1 MAG: hypothetical protein C0626_09510 [Arcobacter sp.]
MKYEFFNDFDFIPYDLVLKFEYRLENVIYKLENFFKNVKIDSFEDEYVEFYLAGSCIKADSFRDIDIFLTTKEKLKRVCSNLDRKYFLYENNSNTYFYDTDLIQLVYRERFLEKDLKFIVDIFDFYSTKIGFKCVLNTKNFTIEIVEADIRKEFVDYVLTKKNGLSRVNTNPFVSLQRAIHFLSRGDDVPFYVFLEIFSKISQIDKSEPIEKYFDRLQGDENRVKEVKEAINKFLSFSN